MRLLYKYLIIFCINLICYYRSIDGDFVFDDSVAIFKNRDVYEGKFDEKTFEVRKNCENLRNFEWKGR